MRDQKACDASSPDRVKKNTTLALCVSDYMASGSFGLSFSFYGSHGKDLLLDIKIISVGRIKWELCKNYLKIRIFRKKQGCIFGCK